MRAALWFVAGVAVGLVGPWVVRILVDRWQAQRSQPEGLTARARKAWTTKK